MTPITPIQARQRFAKLPSILQDAMFSMQNAEIIDQTTTQNSIPEEKAGKIGDLVGWVLLGFIHAEDMATELQATLGVPSKAADEIARSLENKIFNPLKGELDKIYAPALHKDEAAPGPKIIQDIGPVLTASQATLRMQPVSAPPLPKPAAAGWSRSTPEQPVVRLSQPSVPSLQNAQNMASSRVPPPAPKPVEIPIKGPVGEFERIAAQKGAPRPPVVLTGPAPIIIHEDASFKPAQQPPNFHLQLPTEQFNMQKGTTPTPMRPAVLELGNPAPGAAGRVVHYTEYKSPSPAAPVSPQAPAVPQGPRQITEITPQGVPLPPAPSVPIMAKPSASNIPTAPLPPAPTPQTRVLYKDYSEPPAPKAPPMPPPPAPKIP